LTLEILFFWKDFSREEVMVPWRAIGTGGLGAVGMARDVVVVGLVGLSGLWFCVLFISEQRCLEAIGY
jgi:hypothetical protein